MFKYSILAILPIMLIMSCSRRLNTTQESNNYVPYSEVLSIKEIDITNAELNSIISDFIMDLEIFENGVNSFSPYYIDYFASLQSFCRNDSSFILLKATAGSFGFYGHSNQLDNRILEQYRIAKFKNNQILVAKDIEDAFCQFKGYDIFHESHKEVEFTFEWYKTRNGERLIDFHPYFYKIYYIDKEKIKLDKLNFPDPIEEIR